MLNFRAVVPLGAPEMVKAGDAGSKHFDVPSQEKLTPRGAAAGSDPAPTEDVVSQAAIRLAADRAKTILSRIMISLS
jgi:hypothetical protein